MGARPQLEPGPAGPAGLVATRGLGTVQPRAARMDAAPGNVLATRSAGAPGPGTTSAPTPGAHGQQPAAGRGRGVKLDHPAAIPFAKSNFRKERWLPWGKAPFSPLISERTSGRCYRDPRVGPLPKPASNRQLHRPVPGHPPE